MAGCDRRPNRAAELDEQRREAAVEPHLQPVVAGLPDDVEDVGQLVVGEGERLLDEDGLAGRGAPSRTKRAWRSGG